MSGWVTEGLGDSDLASLPADAFCSLSLHGGLEISKLQGEGSTAYCLFL